MRHRGNNRIEKRDWILLRSLFASDQQDFRRCCRLIDQIDVGAVPLAFVQVFCKGQKMLFFLASRRMAAVHGNAYEPIWFQPGKAASYSPHGGTGRCCAAFVCAGQIAQVEYGGLDKGLYMIRKMLVGIADHFDGAVFLLHRDAFLWRLRLPAGYRKHRALQEKAVPAEGCHTHCRRWHLRPHHLRRCTPAQDTGRIL